MRNQWLYGRIVVVLLALLANGPMAVSAEPATPAKAPAATSDAGQTPEVRLAVIIVVDQLRGDLLSRYGRWFGQNGFKRLIQNGAYFPNAYYTHSANSTAVGHATIATGRLPRQHGITNNEWFVDPQSRKPGYVVLDKDVQPVGLAQGETAEGYSPRFLIGATIGDALKLADRRSRVFSVSLKPLASIMLGGQNPDGVYWWDRTSSRFLTSTWYAKELPAYVAEFNNNHYADKLLNTTWERVLPEAAYAGCRPVDPKWITYDYGVGPSFPHRLTKVEGKPMGKRYDCFYGSPSGNDFVLGIANRIITNEKLGRGPATDLLCVSLSANDIVGHVFGPDSAESMDMTVRTDEQIASLLTSLDNQVGLSRCMITLTGDHGVKEIPEVSEQMRLGGQHLDVGKLIAGLNETLAAQAGQLGEGKNYILGFEPPWLWFDHSFTGWTIDKQTQVMYLAAEYLNAMPGVATVFTAAELEEPPPLPEDRARWLAWRSYCPGRSGQLYVGLEPFWYETDEDGTTGHGSDQSEDRHVPILLTGPGIKHGRYMRTVDPMDIAPTLAAGIGIESPNDCRGRVVAEAFDER